MVGQSSTPAVRCDTDFEWRVRRSVCPASPSGCRASVDPPLGGVAPSERVCGYRTVHDATRYPAVLQPAGGCWIRCRGRRGLASEVACSTSYTPLGLAPAVVPASWANRFVWTSSNTYYVCLYVTRERHMVDRGTAQDGAGRSEGARSGASTPE